MGRAIRRLRADGQMAAVVDLTQIGTRHEQVDSARWHYSIAYRICRELRLKVDLQDWWHERGFLLNEQRLAEFFWDIVLANTTVAVTVFFDDAERAIDSSFSGELFAAVQSCYMRRVSEPEYTRLNFVVLGAAAPSQLCPDPSVSAFAQGVAIRLDDFTLEESMTLAPGLRQPESDVRKLFEAIHGWTHGQPYLTQKLARGVARREGQLFAVNAVAHDLFLAPGISREEPYLTHMRALLTDGSARARQALAMLKRLAKGGEVIYDPASQAQLLLHVGGFVSSDENGMLRFRNRIVEQVFDASWSQSVPETSWRRPARTAAVAVAAVLLLSFWYIRILPRPYIDTLTLVTSDYALAVQAHQRLRRLPGFGRRADRMLADVIVRQSAAADSIDDVRSADGILRSLPGRAAQADELMANFWLRRSDASAHRGERDVALVNAIAAIDAGSARAVAVATNLIDDDYLWLAQTAHLDLPVRDFEVDWDRDQIIGVDETQRLFRLAMATTDRVGPNPSSAGARPVFSVLTALQQVGVTRGLFVDEPGRAGSFQLRLTVDHGRTSDLLVRLMAPSGAAAEVGLPARDGTREQFQFTASVQNGLARLADESITGQWELTVFDRLSGESGRLVSWGLNFPGVPQDWPDDPVDGIPLPDPVRTEQVTVALAGDGRKAIAIPSRSDVRGAASVWDVGTGERIADLPLADRANVARFIGANNVLVAGPMRAMLWQLGSAEPTVELVAAGGFSAPPVVSPDGRFFAIAESVGDQTRVTLYAVGDGRIVSRFEAQPWQDWSLAADAQYLAVIDGSRRGRLVNPLTGESLGEFFHERELQRAIAARDRVIAVDRLGQILTWPLVDGGATLTPADSMPVGRSIDTAGITLSADEQLLSFVDTAGLVNVSTLEGGSRRAVFDPGEGSAIEIRFSPDVDRLVSSAGTRIRSWRVPTGEPPGQAFGDVSAVTLAADGAVAVLGYRSGKVQLLRDVPESIDRPVTAEVDYIGHRGVVTSLAVSASGNLAASGASDGLVRVWNMGDGSPRPYLLRHPSGPVDALAFSPDDRWLVSTAAGSARVFDLETGERVNEIEADGRALAVAFAPDSRVVAVGDSAGNIVLASPDGSQGVLTIRGRSPITALRYAENGSILASGSSDGSLVIWDTLEVRATEGVFPFSAPIGWIDFSADFDQVYVQSGAWLHRLDRGAVEPVVTASSLLPSRLRNNPALTQPVAGTVRALVDAGGGRLALADVALASTDSRDRDGETSADANEREAMRGSSGVPVTERDWRRVLGLEIDLVTGTVLPLRP
jgi:WD40 repeat protein